MKTPLLPEPFLAKLLLILLFAATRITPAFAFDKAKCNADVAFRLTNGSLAKDDPIFYRHQGVIFSDTSNIALTIPGCRKACGGGASFYTDVGPRLTTWLIPILLLIGNMQIARLGPRKYLMIFHIIGDPIDTMWSLLTKAEAWSRCFSMAKRDLRQLEHEDKEEYMSRVLDRGTLYAAMEELDGPGTDLFKQRFNEILQQKRLDMTMEHFYHICKETANELSDSRSIELLRAGLAVFSYLFHVIAAFVEAVGGKSSSPPGGRIGTAMFISWLIPVVMLSNAIGGFTSRRTCLRVLERFVKTVTRDAVEDRQMFSGGKISQAFGRWQANDNFYDAQQWYGALYCYRPEKNLFYGGPMDHSRWLLLFLSTLPVLFATVSSFALIWVTPMVGMSCRHLMILGITGLWILSAFLTWVTWRAHMIDGRFHYMITVIKDIVIGVPVFLLIILSSCGIFNSCWCWSAVYSRGRDAHIILDDKDEREQNAHSYYPGMVSACLALQFAVFFYMLRLSKHGSALFRRNEKKKQDDWIRTHQEKRHLSVSSAGGSPRPSYARSRSSSATQLLRPRADSTPLSPGGFESLSRLGPVIYTSSHSESGSIELDRRPSSADPLLLTPEREFQNFNFHP